VIGEDSAADQPFRECGACGRVWRQWREFILDPGVRLLGLQLAPGMQEANLLVFEHSCGSSISVLASRLRHLVPDDEPDDLRSLYGTEACAEHCRVIENLARCDQACANARDRRLAVMLHEIKLTRNLPDPAF